MSDKSFGDQTSRNVVKNPLLSTAVTGLSIEDLTHNAVLLPAIPTQELIVRQDNEAQPLRHPEHESLNIPYGNAKPNTAQFSSPPPINPLPLSPHPFDPFKESHDLSSMSQSKAESKCDDDFDVNEYFARLQGTRYVSAPLNSNIKEDQGANLQAEDNLEEINLNEPDKGQSLDQHHDFQQSLTADIAQNFSQLPTVIPQVASVVFSSFSNMLSLKGREQISDTDNRVYQEPNPNVQNIPLMTNVREVPKDIAPPPLKEPPTGLAASYRMASKKKAYAPIPGLSSGDHNVPTFQPLPSSYPQTTYFTPDNLPNMPQIEKADASVELSQNPLIFHPYVETDSSVSQIYDKGNISNIFNPIQTDQQTSAFQSDVITPIQRKETIQLKQQQIITTDTENQSGLNYNNPSTPIIPPPPMFSNMRRDNQATSKSVLPPSVARRIAGSQPVISFTPHENIFTPSVVIDTTDSKEFQSGQELSEMSNEPSTNVNATSDTQNEKIFETSSHKMEPFTSVAASTLSSSYGHQNSLIGLPLNITSAVGPKLEISSSSGPTVSTDMLISDLPESSYQQSNKCIEEEKNIYSIFSKPQANESNISEGMPVFLDPTAYSQTEFTINKTEYLPTVPEASQYFTSSKPPETVKPLTEPPKLTGNINYRMSKKRPQYYSGPIEGVGNISNNVKPMINPVEPAFQGALFTPDTNSHTANNAMYPNYASSDAQMYTQCTNAPSTEHLSDFNTAFDLSRPTTNSYEQQQETKNFGIIGSFKSSLNYFDNFQEKVTTLFQPIYKKSEFETTDSDTSSVNFYSKVPQYMYGSSAEHTSSINDTPAFVNMPNYPLQLTQPEYQNQNLYNSMQTEANLVLNVPPRTVTNTDYSNINAFMHPPTSSILQNVILKNNQRSSNETFKDSENQIFLVKPEYGDNLKNPQHFNVDNQNNTILIPHSYSVAGGNNTNINLMNSYKTEKHDFLSTSHSDLGNQFGIAGNSFPIGFESLQCDDVNSTQGSDYSNKNILDTNKNPTGTILNQHQTTTAPPNLITKDSFLVSDVSTQDFLNFPIISHVSKDTTSKGFFDKETPIVLPFQTKKLEGNIIKKVFKDVSELPASLSKLENQIQQPKVAEHFTKKSPELVDLVTGDLPHLGLLKNDDSKDCTLFTSEDKTIHDADEVSPAFSLFEKASQVPSVSLLLGIPPTHTNAYSVPADYLDIKNLEYKVERTSLIDHPDAVSIEPKNVDTLLDDAVSELNICETCREVKNPEKKEVEDLTTQLIGNITAPIQLANPVEYPIPDDIVEESLKKDADLSTQFSNVMEVMKIPPPIDPVENSILNYGWSSNEAGDTADALADDNHDYGFQINSSAIGFFQDKFLEDIPTNASDEIKAEFQISQENTPLLPHQIPTASLEEDSKSDESGLDVHSIEQDAKKDFPLYEEFVVGPSETDDGKIEYKERGRSSDESETAGDTFTNRVERFKNANDNVVEIKKPMKPIELPTSSSPSLTIASYFDTGNYAVENHYRNSLTSPSTLTTYNTNTNVSMRIPPGFEEEYHRRLSGISQDLLPALKAEKYETTMIDQNLPSIITQEDDSFCDSYVETMIKELIEEDITQPKSGELLPCLESTHISAVKEDDNIGDLLKIQPTSLEKPLVNSLPDPTSFFSLNQETPEPFDAYSDFSRLSSYFASPPKSEHSKSFFELSQSQNHYRHKPLKTTYDCMQSNVTTFFEDPIIKDKVYNSKLNENIPQTVSQSLSLIHDLTSIKHFQPNQDIVRTVNYFAVDTFRPIETIITKPNSNYIKNTINSDDIDKYLKYTDESKTDNLIVNCIYGSDVFKADVTIGDSQYKVRKSMNSDSDNKEGCDMEFKKEGPKKSLTVNLCDTTLQEDGDDNIVIMAESEICSQNQLHALTQLSALFQMTVSWPHFLEQVQEQVDSSLRSLMVEMEMLWCFTDFDSPRFVHFTADTASGETDVNRTSSEYSAVKYHWFYKVEGEEKSVWRGFSMVDSRALEIAFNSPELNENTLVPTDGGRFDVNIVNRLRTAVYWTETPTTVMRCSWFYKSTSIDPRYIPYAEDIAERLEEEYRHGVTTGEWHRRLLLPNNEVVVMHGPSVMVHFMQNSNNDAFANSPQSTTRPRVVRRGGAEAEVEEPEPSGVDHLLLLCHGVGSACDMRFRSVEEVVNDFRATSLQLIQSHYKSSYDSGLVGRVEVLPISWHSSLHSGMGVDKRLEAVTLESIPRLRNFTNDTILDVLFYTSPVFCQLIIDTVCSELNRIYSLFKSRNSEFKGGVSLGGHSLGSVILYDLLCHQSPKKSNNPMPDKSYVTGAAGTGQPCVNYPRLEFSPEALYALGSPIAIFECIRGVESLGKNFCLPTCRKFFNIFHPYDPIAYRIEPLIDPQLKNVKPYLIPHHKGRKRMHLELKDTMARVGADIKQKVIESIKNTWTSMWKSRTITDKQLEKVVEEEMEKEDLTAECNKERVSINEVTADKLGKLNDGRRIDYVLQEAPFEMINEYLFAMTSHVCYWESEDTMLVMLREMYSSRGVTPDSCLPQHTLTVHRTRTGSDDDDDSRGLSPDAPSTSRGGL